jgi:hypothetical protein
VIFCGGDNLVFIPVETSLKVVLGWGRIVEFILGVFGPRRPFFVKSKK